MSSLSMSLSNVAGALQNPKGMTVHCHSPKPVVKAVLEWACSDRGTCQLPLLRLSEKNLAKPLIPSRGYESLTVISLTGLKLTQKCQKLGVTFFGTLARAVNSWDWACLSTVNGCEPIEEIICDGSG